MSNERGIHLRVGRSAAVTLLGTLAVVIVVAIAGCGQGSQLSSAPAAKSGDQDHNKKGDHGTTGHSHVAPHGGQVQSVGDNHFELTYDSEVGRFSLYVLGQEESKAAPVSEAEISLQIRNSR